MKSPIYRIAICAGILFSLLFSSGACASPPEDPKNPQQQSIEKVRKGTLKIKGEPGTHVQIEQLNHEFWFGCAISSQVFAEKSRMSEEDIKMYKQKFLENFNSAVTENAVKWGSMERNRGEIDYATSDHILDWTETNSIPCRGHNLYWGIDQFVQNWVKELEEEELREAVQKRGIVTARHFKGRFVEYDLNNEMIHGNYYAENLGDGITKEMANWVLEGDPNAQLWLNDYDILTGIQLDAFLKHIRTMLKAYQELIFNEWNTDLSVELDENGEAIVPAFYRDYKISVGQKEVRISLEKEEGSKVIVVN